MKTSASSQYKTCGRGHNRTHPASTMHSKLPDAERAAVSILPGMVRISVGLADAADIEQALDKSR